MSRIGKMPIAIPNGVEVKIDNNLVTVQGPKGLLSKQMRSEINIEIKDQEILVTRSSDEPLHRSLHGLTRMLIANMVEGVTKGFEKGLELVGVGYRAAKQGEILVLTVGKSHPVELTPYAGLEFDVPAPNRILVKGTDKELVGAWAAEIRSQRKPEPYKGKGIRYAGEVVRRKAGKAGGAKAKK
ncbi:MAG: 50S ribosomal protein L6 [Peptococcaceae bacterium]|jgi:large subunit ribosomal protein L6|nr:50S ribosomal protein L6 [Peptococcaceae bacterium]